MLFDIEYKEVMNLKRVTFLVDDNLYKRAKIRSVLSDQNMTEYLVSLIKKDLLETETKKEQTQ